MVNPILPELCGLTVAGRAPLRAGDTLLSRAFAAQEKNGARYKI
jgi:hypothetical protein